MHYLKSVNFQYYPGNVKIPKPLGLVTLETFYEGIKEPNQNSKEMFRSIAKCEASGDMKTKAQLKQNNLLYVTPCVVTNGKGRKYDNIVSFTGLAVLDFDHIDDAEEFKQFIFNKFDSVAMAFLSPSKRGVKFIIRIPVVHSVDEFKSYFYGIGHYFDRYRGWDGSGQNCILPLFTSWDENILVRDNPTVWKIKGKKFDAFAAFPSTNVKIQATDDDKKRILGQSKAAFDAIVDNGHPQLRALCVSLGGYVSSGYLSEQEAIDFVFPMIEGHSYLRKGVKGYQKTALTAIRTGMNKQLKLE